MAQYWQSDSSDISMSPPTVYLGFAINKILLHVVWWNDKEKGFFDEDIVHRYVPLTY